MQRTGFFLPYLGIRPSNMFFFFWQDVQALSGRAQRRAYTHACASYVTQSHFDDLYDARWDTQLALAFLGQLTWNSVRRHLWLIQRRVAICASNHLGGARARKSGRVVSVSGTLPPRDHSQLRLLIRCTRCFQYNHEFDKIHVLLYRFPLVRRYRTYLNTLISPLVVGP